MSAAPAWRIEAAHLHEARDAVARHARETALVHAPSVGSRVWLKLETEQVTGSFKVRGALTKLSAVAREAPHRGVVAASAGNHGLGVAYAAQRLELQACIHVPPDTPAVKRDGIAALGAHVVVGDAPGYDATEQQARRAADADGGVFVSPFDDPWVAAGNGGTIGLEVLESLDDVTTIVAPVGGGGLMAGLGAARDHLRRDVRLVGTQSEACPAMARSLAEDRPIERLSATDTLAEGLEGGVSPTSFHHVREAVTRLDALPEVAIADAMRFAWKKLALPLEGSSAVALAWARDRAVAEPGEGPIVVVLTGRNVDEATLDRIAGEPTGGAAQQDC